MKSSHDKLDYSNPVFMPKSVYAILAEDLLDYVRPGDNDLVFCENKQSEFVLLNYMGDKMLCLMNCPTLNSSRHGFEQDKESLEAFTQALAARGMQLIHNDGCWIVHYNGSASTSDGHMVGIIAEIMDASITNAKRYAERQNKPA